MDVPSLKRENTIGINYVRGLIRDSHFGYIIGNILGVPDSEIDGIDDRGNCRFILKVTTAERYESICENFVGRDIPIGYGNIIQVDDISSYGTMVEISRVPFEISNEILTNMLKKFGDVYKCQSYYRRFGKYTSFNTSGKRIAWMKINDHIPQSLKINQTQTTMDVSYQDQPYSCNVCGNAGHRARQCNVDTGEYKCRIDIVDNSEDEDTGSVHLEEEIVTDMDIHIDPSQASNPLECSLCDYSCKYENILQEHMKTHTDEKTNKCNGRKDIPNTNEILLQCTECDYNCKNNDVLLNHLKSHNIFKCNKCDFITMTPKGLSNHMKTHKGKQFNCSECEFTTNTQNKLNAHTRKHIDDSITVESLAEIVSSQTSEKTPTSSNKSKRGLSTSPESVDNEKKPRK